MNEKTVIRANTEKYQRAKAASGAMSQHNGDVVASTLAGLPLESVLAIASTMTSVDLSTKYAHLNPGQQRMNLGNRIRGAVAKINKSIEKAEAALAAFHASEAKEGVEAPVVPSVTGEQALTAVAAEYVAAAKAAAELEAKAAADAKAAKEAEAKAKAEAKAAKAKKEAPADEAAAE